MRNMIIILVCFFSMGYARAQEKVSVKLEKLTKNGRMYAKVSITNNSKTEDIIVNNDAIATHEGEFGQAPKTYMVFTGSSTDIIKKSGMIVFDETIGLYQKRKTRFKIKAGETFTDEVLLFGTSTSPYIPFIKADSSVTKQLQVSLYMTYFISGNKESYQRHKEFVSNTISL